MLYTFRWFFLHGSLLVLSAVLAHPPVLPQASPYPFVPPAFNLPAFSIAGRDGDIRRGAVKAYTETAGGSVRLVGGIFNRAGGQPRRNVAAFDQNWRLLSWPVFVYYRSAPGHSGEVHGLVVHGSWVLIAGAFDTVSGLPRRGLAAVRLDTGEVSPWSPELVGGGILPPVAYCLERHRGKLYVGGSFRAISHRGSLFERVSLCELVPAGDPESGEFRPTAADFALEQADPGTPLVPVVFSLALRASTLYAGGTLLDRARGEPRGNGAAFGLHAQGAELLEWDPRADGEIYSLVPCSLDGGWIFAGGSFTEAGGRRRLGLAQLDPRRGHASPWDARLSPYADRGRVRFVRAALRGNVLYAAGEFRAEEGRMPGIAAFDATTGARGYWRPFLTGGPERGGAALFLSHRQILVDYAASGLTAYAEQLRGDADGDGRVAGGDVVAILDYLFGSGPELAADPMTPEPYGGDADGDGRIDAADASSLARHLFRGGPPPPP